MNLGPNDEPGEIPGDDPLCDERGEPFMIDEAGIATHLTTDGGVDHDADHVPYSNEEANDDADDDTSEGDNDGEAKED